MEAKVGGGLGGRPRRWAWSGLKAMLSPGAVLKELVDLEAGDSAVQREWRRRCPELSPLPRRTAEGLVVLWSLWASPHEARSTLAEAARARPVPWRRADRSEVDVRNLAAPERVLRLPLDMGLSLSHSSTADGRPSSVRRRLATASARLMGTAAGAGAGPSPSRSEGDRHGDGDGGGDSDGGRDAGSEAARPRRTSTGAFTMEARFAYSSVLFESSK